MGKIVYLSKSPMLYDTRVRYIMQSIKKMGYESVVIAEKNLKSLLSEEYNDFRIMRVLSFSGLYARERHSGNVSKKKKKENSLISFLKKSKLRKSITIVLNRFFWNFGTIYQLYKESPEIVISRDPTTLLVGYLYSKLKKIPLIYDSHEIWEESALYLKSSKFMQFYWDTLEKKVIKKIDHVFYTTESRAKYAIKKYGINNVSVLRNTSPYKEYKIETDLRKEFQISIKDKILIYHGQISEIRGVYDLVKAIENIDNCVLIFMGMGNNIGGLKNYVEELNLSDRVFFKAPVKPQKVITTIKSADIGIQPFHYTLNIYTAISIKLLECIMAGIAVVGVDFPEIFKIITNNEIGNTFETQNIKSLKKAIEDLVNNPHKLDICKNNAKKVQKKYSWEIDEKKLFSIINNLKREA